MRARTEVMLYDLATGRELYKVSRAIAVQLVGSGEAIERCSHCFTEDKRRPVCDSGKRQHSFIFGVTQQFYNRTMPSGSSLTERDMMASVGIVDEARRKHSKRQRYGLVKTHQPNAMKDKAFVQRARQKIWAWPFEHDDLAVLVLPRQISRPRTGR